MGNIAGIVETGACSGCGMCVAACPQGAVRIEHAYRPAIIDKCDDCGICREMCPRVEMPYGAIEAALAGKHQAKEHDDLIGYFTRIYLSRAADKRVRSIAYSGGTTTAFIQNLLEQGLIDAALLTDKAHRLPYCAHPQPKVVVTPDVVLSCAFTKPTVNPLLAHLPVPGARVAIVGNSCHIEAVRKAMFLAKNGRASGKRAGQLVDNIRFLVGLCCFFSNRPSGVDTLLEGIGLKESDIKRWFYDRGIPTVELPDNTCLPVPQANTNFDVLNPGCLLCYPSYTARLSDVTFGKTMSEEWGWNDVICRSTQAEEILTAMQTSGIIESKSVGEEGMELLDSLREARVFNVDAVGYAAYLETGSFRPDEVASEMMSRSGGSMKGKTRLKLIQSVRKHSFYEPIVSARKAKHIFVPQLT